MANFKKITLPANIVLLSALILSVLVTISLPLLTALDITRVTPGKGERIPGTEDFGKRISDPGPAIYTVRFKCPDNHVRVSLGDGR